MHKKSILKFAVHPLATDPAHLARNIPPGCKPRNKNWQFQGCQKSPEDLKILSLHSMNSSDAIEAMEKSCH